MSTLFRAGLRLVIWQVGLVAAVWLLHHFHPYVNHFYFVDVLFVIGALELFVAGFGMMSRTFDVYTPIGVNAFPVQPDDLDESVIEEQMRKKEFSIRLAVSGVITILIAALLL